MQHFTQIAEHPRRRDDNELLEQIGVRVAIERFGQFAGEPLLGNIVPVGFFQGAAGHTDACARPRRTICSLLARRWIVAFQNFLDDKPETVGRALVAQEKRLLTIADQNECVVWNVRAGFHDHA